MEKEKESIDNEEDSRLVKKIGETQDHEISWKGILGIGAAVAIYFLVPKVNSVIENLDPRVGIFNSKYEQVSKSYADKNKDYFISSQEYSDFHSKFFKGKELYSFSPSKKITYNRSGNWPEYSNGEKVPIDSMNSWLDIYSGTEKN